MKTIDALRQADRHCDMESLPPASPEARALDQVLTSDRASPDQAVRALVTLHKRSATDENLRESLCRPKPPLRPM